MMAGRAHWRWEALTRQLSDQREREGRGPAIPALVASDGGLRTSHEPQSAAIIIADQ